MRRSGESACMYDKADRKKIREEVSTRIADESGLHASSSKDELEAAVNGVLGEHVARARPSPYAGCATNKLTFFFVSYCIQAM